MSLGTLLSPEDRTNRHLAHPDHGAGELESRQEVDGASIVSGSDATKMLEPVEEALNAVAQLVSDSVMGNEGLSVAERRDNRCRSGIGDELAQSVVVVGLVGDDGSGRTTGEESGRGCAVMRLTARQDEAQRAAEGIDEDMDFGRQSS
jgi:hypothetical protein